MTILAAIEAIKATLPAIKTFHYASLEEANIEADYLTSAEFPLMLVLPITVTDNAGTTGVLKSTTQLHMFFLNKDTSQRTVEHKASEIETSVVAPMRLLARQFVHKLMEYRPIIDTEVADPVTDIQYIPAYSSMDSNVHGVEVFCTARVMERPNVC
jgi:hypothetical protein